MVVSTTCGGVHLSQCFNSYVYTVADRGVQKKTDAEDRDEVLVWYYGFVVFELSYIIISFIVLSFHHLHESEGERGVGCLSVSMLEL